MSRAYTQADRAKADACPDGQTGLGAEHLREHLGGNIRGRGWVLYDDGCGFCRTWVPYWEKTLNRRGFAIAPIQSDWVVEALKLPDGEVPTDIRLLLADGGQVVGADVYRHVMRRIWWAYPVYLLSCVPFLRGLFDAAYRAFARNRFRFSKACGLPGADQGGARRAGRP